MNEPSIGIIDAGAANYASIAAGIRRAGGAPHFVREPGDVGVAEALVLPGVANAGFVLDELERLKLRAPLETWLAADRPLLGICAGFQVLFSASDEAPGRAAVGFFDGTVRRLSGPKQQHIGWSAVDGDFYVGWAYFAHGYAVPRSRDACATTRFGERFVSVAARGNVLGVQFHPERSGAYGDAFLARFVSSLRGIYAR
jgi:imidazole glycerol phosphate synthase glutamine amidotransferase subunit